MWHESSKVKASESQAETEPFDVAEASSQCLICRDDFATMQPPDTKVVRLTCEHCFCCECIEHWFGAHALLHSLCSSVERY